MKQIKFNKIYIILILCTLISFSCFGNKYIRDEFLNNYYKSYFGSKPYTIWDDQLVINDKIFITAVSYIDKERGIIEKAVVVEKKGEKIIPHLYFEKYKILNKNRKVIVNLSSSPLKYYGWKISYSIPKDENYNKGFNTDYISNNGDRVTDGPRIEWNEKSHLFVEDVFDTSQ